MNLEKILSAFDKLTQLDAAIEINSRAKKFNRGEFVCKDVQTMIGRLKERDEDGLTLLHMAARNIPDAEMIRSMIVLEADIHAKDNDGRTPLHHAADGNPNVDVVKCLVEQGADPNVKDNKGRTPTDLAISFAKSEEVGLYFFDLSMGQTRQAVVDPAVIAKIKRSVLWSEALGGAEVVEE